LELAQFIHDQDQLFEEEPLKVTQEETKVKQEVILIEPDEGESLEEDEPPMVQEVVKAQEVEEVFLALDKKYITSNFLSQLNSLYPHT